MTTTSVGITNMLVKSLPLKQNPILMARIKMLSLLERLVIMMAGFVQVIMSWLVSNIDMQYIDMQFLIIVVYEKQYEYH